MSTPLSILEGKLKQARRAYAEVECSMRLRGGILRHGIRKYPEGTARDDYSYRHKGLEWRCKVLVSGQVIQTYALHWWQHGPKGHRNEALDAILLRGGLMPLHFDSHFFSRWGLSRADGGDAHQHDGLFQAVPRSAHAFAEAESQRPPRFGPVKNRPRSAIPHLENNRRSRTFTA